MKIESEIRERMGWVAAALGLTMPGLGQIYNGELVKGLSVFIIFLSMYLGGFHLAVLLPSGWLLSGVAVTFALVLSCYLLALVDSYRKARQEGVSYRVKAFNRWYFYVALWLLASVVIMGPLLAYTKENVIEAYKIVGVSMEPTVLKGDWILVDKTIYRRRPPKVGDIVVFIYPDDRSKVFIRKIAGLPGDRVKLTDGREELVPHGHAYLLGANREMSLDSRDFGFVPLRDLYGRARQIYYSSGAEGVRWGRIGLTISGPEG